MSVKFYPITANSQEVPNDLTEFLLSLRNNEIRQGIVPYAEDELSRHDFEREWFGDYAIVCIQEIVTQPIGLKENSDWENNLLGSIMIKPNYPGRCSHICQADFVINHRHRNYEVRKLLGNAFLDHASTLGYKYAMVNMVFSNDTHSRQIWKELGFDIIGHLPLATQLENQEEFVEAFILGKDLTL